MSDERLATSDWPERVRADPEDFPIQICWGEREHEVRIWLVAGRWSLVARQST